MNAVLSLLGIESWKPVLTVLVLPPVPFLLLLLVGARLILPRRGLGWLVILLSVVGLWLSTCIGTGQLITQWLVKPPPAITADDVEALKAAVKAKEPVAIVVLGGGMEPLAPEYGVSNLSSRSLERLRYGLWLARETGAPVAFSGGMDWGQPEGHPEAQTAARIAAKEFNLPLKWVEDRSRDTHENASRTVPLLKQAGIRRIVLVTHGYHMPRARAQFVRAAGSDMKIDMAPMGLAKQVDSPSVTWLPTPAGYSEVNKGLRELLAGLVS